MATDLIGSGIEQRTLTYLALGGSGIRSIEPLLYLCAFGLGPQLRLVLIDPDQSNAAVKRSRELIELYDAAYAHRGAGFRGFMQVMREGSERYARAAFAENVSLKGAA
jgi:hypothetical protein